MANTRKKAADELSSITRDLGGMLTDGEELLGATAPAAAGVAAASTTESPLAKNQKAPKKVKHPCGKCDAETTGNAVCCNSCELWFHYACVEDMTREWFDNVKKASELSGFSAFLCKICRKVLTSVKKSIKELRDDMKEMADKIVVLELEKVMLAQKLEKIEMKAERVNDRVVGVEKEVATGMEKAKEEVKNDVKSEMAQREERGDRVVVYGLEETKEEDPEWKEKEKKKVEDILRHMGVEPQGDITVKFRAGRAREEGAKPRPLIVKLSDDETRVSFLRNAPKLSRIAETRRIYIAPDLTPQQQQEERKKEAELKEQAEKKNKEEKNGGTRKWVVVGARGRRKVIDVEDRDPQNQ